MLLGTAITIAALSLMGICVLYLRHVPAVARMTPEELAGVLQRERPLLTQALYNARGVSRKIWHQYLRARILTFLVRKIYQVRIVILRTEQALFRAARGLRKRSQTNQPPSDYWQDIHGWRKTVHWRKKEE